jgi:hypothetical protein
VKRRTEVTIEFDEVIIRRSQAITWDWCNKCAEQVQMLTPGIAAAAAGVTIRTIYRRVEAGGLHFTETHEGALLICGNSLS